MDVGGSVKDNGRASMDLETAHRTACQAEAWWMLKSSRPPVFICVGCPRPSGEHARVCYPCPLSCAVRQPRRGDFRSGLFVVVSCWLWSRFF